MKFLIAAIFSALALSLTSPVIAAEPAGVILVLSGPDEVKVTDGFELTLSIESDPELKPESQILLEERLQGLWSEVGPFSIESASQASVLLSASDTSGPRTFRAVFEGDESHASSTSDPFILDVRKVKTFLTAEALPSNPLKRRSFTIRAVLMGESEALESRRIFVFQRQEGELIKRKSELTDEEGVVKLDLKARDEARETYIVQFKGSDKYAASEALLTVLPQDHPLVLEKKVPKTITDQTEATLAYRVRTQDGETVKAARVVLEKKLKGEKKFSKAGARLTDKRGRVSFRVSPRVTGLWRVRIGGGAYYKGKVFKAHSLKNVPPAAPVRSPGPAPRIKLPLQPRAVLKGPAVRISPIPEDVWRSMQGKSWRPGCLPRSSLRYIRTNYLSFDGYARQGELVVAASAAGQYKRALESMYRAKLPIRHMYLVDRFDYSAKLRGANDYRSMAADNTSAFNCRDVVGRPGVKSPHASGRAFDINPWENPYRASYGWTPNTYWVGKSHPRVAWRSGSHPVVRALRAAGFSWTYGIADAHHFDA